jgi:hypothetical protein
MKSQPIVDSRLWTKVPQMAIPYLQKMLHQKQVVVLLARNRRSKSGDYRSPYNGSPQRITINASLNPYSALITLVHEIAHMFVFEIHGRKVAPHGKEWKACFRKLMTELPIDDIFPDPLNALLKNHMIDPRASTFADLNLSRALQSFNATSTPPLTVEKLEQEAVFTLDGKRWFKKLNKRRSRFLCEDVQNRKHYLVHALASVIEQRKA